MVSDETDAKTLNEVQDRFEVDITELPGYHDGLGRDGRQDPERGAGQVRGGHHGAAGRDRSVLLHRGTIDPRVFSHLPTYVYSRETSIILYAAPLQRSIKSQPTYYISKSRRRYYYKNFVCLTSFQTYLRPIIFLLVCF